MCWFYRSSLLLLSLLLAFACTSLARAAFPDHPIRLIVPYAPGGSTDSLARMVAESMGRELGQPVVVENKAGAGGQIGIEALRSSSADGYTIGVVASSNLLAYALRGQKFDFGGQLLAVGGLAQNLVIVITNPKIVNAKSFAEFIDWARSQKDVPYASTGAGSTSHLFMLALAGLEKLHLTNVPYKGCAPALTDTLSGVMGLNLCDPGPALAFLRSGDLGTLGLAGKLKSPLLPDVTLLVDQKLSNDVKQLAERTTISIGFAVPKGLPDDVLGKLRSAFATAANDSSIKDKIVGMGVVPYYLSPEDYRAELEDLVQFWSKVIEDNGLKAE
jgi:tripartite-type tricarboxylate transporter receptor subunit TctC